MTEPSGTEFGQQLLIPPLKAFFSSMQAVLDLDQFISANRRALHDVEALFVAEAERIFPGPSHEKLLEVAKSIHRATHDRMDAETKAAASTDPEISSPDAVEKLRDRYRADLRARLLDLTGDPEDYRRYIIV